MAGLHPSHRTRISLDASSYDEICELCGAHDEAIGGWGALAYPCSANDEMRATYDQRKAKRWAVIVGSNGN